MGKTRRTNRNVLEAARARIAFVFDEFESIIVSISGGKDSTVLCHLALEEAVRRGRKIGLFFLDEEAVYQATVEQIEYLMGLYPENTIRYWLQIEFNLTNSTDLCGAGQLRCWDPNARALWMHKRHNNNILRPPWTHETMFKKRIDSAGRRELEFYGVLYNFTIAHPNTAFLIGLRADEAFTRRITVSRSPGYKGVYWSSKKTSTAFNFYPLYDWQVSDIWHYIYENRLKYHRYYDFAYRRGMAPFAMRVSSLVHEHSFHAIAELPEFEFATYERLRERCKGISFAQETAKNKAMFRCLKLPAAYKTWREYRDFLLSTYPVPERKEMFTRRFARHLENEYVARQQVRQLVLNDYENNIPVNNIERKSNAGAILKRWSEEL